MENKSRKRILLLVCLYVFGCSCSAVEKYSVVDIDCDNQNLCESLLNNYFQSIQLGKMDDARECLEKAAKAGSSRAKYNYFHLHESSGVGSREEAVRYLKEATISADCSVSVVASDLYATEIIEKKSVQDRIKYLEFSASYGFLPSIVKLIHEYKDISPVMAMSWLELAYEITPKNSGSSAESVGLNPAQQGLRP